MVVERNTYMKDVISLSMDLLIQAKEFKGIPIGLLMVFEIMTLRFIQKSKYKEQSGQSYKLEF